MCVVSGGSLVQMVAPPSKGELRSEFESEFAPAQVDVSKYNGLCRRDR